MTNQKVQSLHRRGLLRNVAVASSGILVTSGRLSLAIAAQDDHSRDALQDQLIAIANSPSGFAVRQLIGSFILN